MNLFMSERLECAHCHAGFNFSQFVTHESAATVERAFHVTGLYPASAEFIPAADYGLFAVTNDSGDRDRFKAPTLRNITRHRAVHARRQHRLAERGYRLLCGRRESRH